MGRGGNWHPGLHARRGGEAERGQDDGRVKKEERKGEGRGNERRQMEKMHQSNGKWLILVIPVSMSFLFLSSFDMFLPFPFPVLPLSLPHTTPDPPLVFKRVKPAHHIFHSLHASWGHKGPAPHLPHPTICLPTTFCVQARSVGGPACPFCPPLPLSLSLSVFSSVTASPMDVSLSFFFPFVF
jgi:hypothetical protein